MSNFSRHKKQSYKPYFFIAVAFILFILSGKYIFFSSEDNQNTRENNNIYNVTSQNALDKDSKKVVVVFNKFLKLIMLGILPENYKVFLINSKNSDCESVSITRKDILFLSKSDLVVVGPEFIPYGVKSFLRRNNKMVLDFEKNSKNIEHLKSYIAQSLTKDYDSDKYEKLKDFLHDGDMHFFLTPKLVKKIIGITSSEVMGFFPHIEEEVKRKEKILTEEIEKINGKFKNLKMCNTTFFSLKKSYDYLSMLYGLSYGGALISNNGEIDKLVLSQVSNMGDKKFCIFSEKFHDKRFADILSKKLKKIKVYNFDIVEIDTHINSEDVGTFEEYMLFLEDLYGKIENCICYDDEIQHNNML